MPANSDTLQNALRLHGQGKIAEAEALYRAILEQDPRHAEALHYLGVLSLQRNQDYDAVAHIGLSLSINPDNAGALNNYGSALERVRRWNEALASYDRALALKPDFVEAFYNRGNALHTLKRWDEALASYDQALKHRPGFAEAWNNRGNLLLDMNRPADALASYDRALAISPRFAEAHNNRGKALFDLKRLDDALASYNQAIAIQPDYIDALCNRAAILVELRRLDEALLDCERARAIQPDCAEAHWNESRCHLLRGDFIRGWEKAEWRWRRQPQSTAPRTFDSPLWLGNAEIAGKTLLLYADQGFGDTIQLCRYASLAVARGARVILEVQAPLVSLLSGLDGVSQLIAAGDPIPPHDFHCPLMSAPHAFRTTLSTILAKTPYLHVAPERIAKWEAILGKRTRPRIGLAWSGSRRHNNDRHRSIALERLTGLLECGGTVVCLQKEIWLEDRPCLDAHPEIVHVEQMLTDFADTAALASLLDVIVTVDTSVAHLAAALGLPTWIMLSDLGLDRRWMLERDDSPWYPSVKLYRQPAIDAWEPVIAAIMHDLRVLTTASG